MEELIDELKVVMEQAEGDWSIVVEDVERNRQWAIHENRSYYAASIIKLPIMATAFMLADNGELRLSEQVEVKREDLVGGAGVLQHLSPGIKLSIYDLLTLMIIQSDNTATNILIDHVGVEKIQEMMRHLGMESSSFYHKLMVVPAQRAGRNMITAHDIALLLKKMVQGEISSHLACERMIEMMKKQQIHYIASGFPEQTEKHLGTYADWMFASKTGSVTSIKHDVGILYTKNKTMIITVLSEGASRDHAYQTLDLIGQKLHYYTQHTS